MENNDESSKSTQQPTSKRVRRASEYWTIREDELLTHGKKSNWKWPDIARHVSENGENIRSPKQCAQRWIRIQDPECRKGLWSEEEDVQLLAAVNKHGENAWPKVSAEVPSRNETQCRVRWPWLKKRMEKLEKQLSASTSVSASASASASASVVDGKETQSPETEGSEGTAKKQKKSMAKMKKKLCFEFRLRTTSLIESQKEFLSMHRNRLMEKSKMRSESMAAKRLTQLSASKVSKSIERPSPQAPVEIKKPDALEAERDVCSSDSGTIENVGSTLSSATAKARRPDSHRKVKHDHIACADSETEIQESENRAEAPAPVKVRPPCQCCLLRRHIQQARLLAASAYMQQHMMHNFHYPPGFMPCFIPPK